MTTMPFLPVHADRLLLFRERIPRPISGPALRRWPRTLVPRKSGDRHLGTRVPHPDIGMKGLHPSLMTSQYPAGGVTKVGMRYGAFGQGRRDRGRHPMGRAYQEASRQAPSPRIRDLDL